MENILNDNLGVGNLSNIIYHIRGRDVMLDADLARIYGYTTKAFNQQVKNNLEKFEGEDFMFQLTRGELELLPRSNFLTLDNHVIKNNIVLSRSQNVTLKNARGSNIKYLPYAFTEQGIYMLMTVLHGELAVKQSRALVIAFKKMKDYILENQKQLECRGDLQLAMKIIMNTEDIAKIKAKITELDSENAQLRNKIEEAVMKSEISPIMLDFNKFSSPHEFVFMNGELLEARETYQDIYSRATNNIIIIDNYVNIHTLRLLGRARAGTNVTIFSDNIRNYLYYKDYLDFRKEYPKINIKFLRTKNPELKLP